MKRGGFYHPLFFSNFKKRKKYWGICIIKNVFETDGWLYCTINCDKILISLVWE